jgi:hypothetical protein
MRSINMLSVSAAILSLILVSGTTKAVAQSATSGAEGSSEEHALSQRMVPAQAVLDKSLEGKKTKAGEEFLVTLTNKVKLSDGQMLPGGSILAGTIVTDDMQASGNSKLTVHFTEVRVKGGKAVPVQAVVIGYYDQGSLNAQYGNTGWAPGQVDVKQGSAPGGLTMHSRVGSADSGTFESKKDNVKLDRGNALFVAIAPAGN